MHVKRALLSVSDKTGIVGFGRRLAELGITILSTGGTYDQLREAGVPVTAVDAVTGFPEILGGRVKTLHPYIHGGILARRHVDDDIKQMQAHGIEGIDLVVVNLYPFAQTVARPDATIDEAMENVDIGGPTMVRAAAKNHRHVAVVVDPGMYDDVAAALATEEGIDAAMRLQLAQKAFAHTAAYDAAVAAYLTEHTATDLFPSSYVAAYTKAGDLRYGENPHQKAALYVDPAYKGPTVVGAELLHGKPLSFNNVNDAAAAWDMALEFTEPVAVAVKHTNPCGVGTGANLQTAYERAYNADPVSIFGGIVAVNDTVDAATARMMADIFLEVVVAPDYTEEALSILTQKASLRLLRTGSRQRGAMGWDMKRVRGGLLVQEEDVAAEDPNRWQVVTETAPTAAQLAELWFGWRIVKHVKSNAVLLVRDGQTVGIGAGQMNRILPTRMSIEHAGDRARGAVFVSDAFFPFSDVVEAVAAAGITAIAQPGGSKRDADSIAAANEAGIAMVFTGMRHFKH